MTENASRVFHTADSGKTWTASEAPFVTGLNQGGVFSIAVMDADRLAIVGGDYDHPQMVKPNSAVTDDGGKTWKESSHRPAGYRWCASRLCRTPPVPLRSRLDRPEPTTRLIDGKNWESDERSRTPTL